MSVAMKIKLARIKLFSQKLHKQAQKLALAVLITEYLIAGGWYLAETRGILEFLQPKIITIQIAKPAEAKEYEPKLQEVEAISDIERIADSIWNLESTRGKYNYSKCEAIGKINGIGYGIPGNGKYQCFNNHAEEMEVLRGWIISKKSQGLSEQELLCLYSGNNYKGCK